jgi:putative acetyltransferase
MASLNMQAITDAFIKEMLQVSQTYTAVILKKGPNDDLPEKQQVVWEHVRRNFQLRADGLLSIVCPVSDQSDTKGIGIFNTDIAKTKELMDGDPGVIAGIFVYDLHPVRSFPGDRLPIEKAAVQITRTDSSNTTFQQLVSALNAEFSIVDGADHAFYSQFNNIDVIKYVVIAYDNDRPVGCGAIKQYEEDAVEIKRMYVLPDHRGKGVAVSVLKELEKWAKELGYKRCVLETGKRLPAAIKLYQKNGYRSIPNYGQYIGVENSVCFEKTI